MSAAHGAAAHGTTATTTATVPRARETWVDAAKGIAILGVVLFHSVLVMADLGLAWRWREASDLLDTFRMPLFFLTAGLFSAAVLAQPFRVLVHRRVARLMWLYGLWSTVWVAAFAVLPWPRPDVARPSPSELPLLLVRPNDTTWFVYGLALFFVVTWLARRLPTPVLLGGAALLSVAAALVDTGSTAIDKMGTYYVFFAAAVRLGPRVREVAARIRAWHALVVALAYAAVAVVVTATGLLWFPGGRLATGVLAVVAGVSVAVVLSRHRWAAWLVGLGRRTLAVYLLHSYVVLGAAAVLAGDPGALGDWSPLVVPVLTVVATVLSLAVHRVTRGVPGLYDLPRRAARALEPRGRSSSRAGAGSVAERTTAA